MSSEIVFTPSGRRTTAETGATVLEVARSLGVDIDSVCAGRGICGRCQVIVGSNPSIEERPDHLSPPGPTETEYRGRKPLGDDRRLACAARILGDVVIDVPPDSRVHRQLVRKRPEVDSLPIDPVFRLAYVEVDEATLDGIPGDLERLFAALARDWGITDARCDVEVVRNLHATLEAGSGAITVGIRDGSQIVATWPGFHDRAFGVAFDIGSTTVAAHLCDLATGSILASEGVMNPQIRFGEDLMSRVSHAMMHDDAAATLTAIVREAMDGLIDTILEGADVEREEIVEVVAVGNPIMHHLALGFDPTPLGTAPFAAATTGPIEIPAERIGLSVHPAARVYFLPLVAGHVGADTTAAVLSEGPHRHSDIQLLVDVGTNAEIVLGNSQRLVAASSPTGPAFEGAQISSGQRAAPGAIERVRVDRDTWAVRFKVIGSDLWSDDEGFDAGVSGICGSGIIEAVAEMWLAGIISSDGVIGSGDGSERVVPDGRTHAFVLHRDGDTVVSVTQNDVRAIQLAKAALYAGIRLLMDEMGIEGVDRIRLAGAFGTHIDPLHAMVLGMIPDCDLDHVTAAGNAAGTGAMLALLSGAARREIEDVARSIHRVETAVEPRFQEHFVEAMAIPHGSAKMPKLATSIALPDPTVARRPSRRRARRSDDD